MIIFRFSFLLPSLLDISEWSDQIKAMSWNYSLVGGIQLLMFIALFPLLLLLLFPVLLFSIVYNCWRLFQLSCTNSHVRYHWILLLLQILFVTLWVSAVLISKYLFFIYTEIALCMLHKIDSPKVLMKEEDTYLRYIYFFYFIGFTESPQTLGI